MKKNFQMKYSLFMFIAALFLGLAACKKDPVTPDPPPTVDSTRLNTPENRMRDTAYWYSQDIYLWYDQLPTDQVFAARKYKTLNDIMMAIRPFSKEPANTGTPKDRWSFAIDKASWDNVSSGIEKDFGVNIFFLVQGDLRVRYVEKNSPADKAGVQRGWRITKINNITNITTDNANAIVEAVYYSAKSDFTFLKPDGNSTTISLESAQYQSNPILLDTVYHEAGKSIGYMVYNSFLGDQEATVASFDRIFNKFSSGNVKDVIVDLRYNGGGYVSLQAALANYLAPATANGKIMMMQQFNQKYSQYNDTLNFSKKGSLNPAKLIFIVSEATASASELLINNLKPFFSGSDFKIVGPRPSYGKPVGYFNIPVGDQYIFPVSFRSVNNVGVGNYYEGFVPDKVVGDGIDKNWGDLGEASLAAAYKYIVTGGFGFVKTTGTTLDASAGANRQEADAFNRKVDSERFHGMVDSRKLDFNK